MYFAWKIGNKFAFENIKNNPVCFDCLFIVQRYIIAIRRPQSSWEFYFAKQKGIA